MKNLKRVLSLGLASVMLLGMMVMGASAKDFTDADKIVNGEAVQVLVALKIVNGKEDGSFFDPEGTVTRGEMAKMIAVAMNGGSESNTGVKGTPSFTDIGGHWAEGWIEYCADMGIITGRGDGTFDPNGLVTGTEALKMVLTALGYDAVAYKLTGASWASQTLENARKTGNKKLTDNLDSVVMSQPATRDTAAQMIWNGLQAYIVDISPDKNTSSGEVTWGYKEVATTMLELRYAAHVETGVFDGNADYNDSSASPADGEIAVTLASPYGACSFPGDMSIDYIGEEVKVVWKNGAKSLGNGPDKNDTIFGVFVTGATRVERTTMGKVKDHKNSKQQINLNGVVCDVADSVEIVTNYIGTETVTDVKGTDQTASANGTNSTLTGKIKASRGDAIKAVFDGDGKVCKIYITTAKIASVTSINSTNITMNNTVGTVKIADNDVEDGLKKGDVVVVTTLYGANAQASTAKTTVKKADKVSGEVEAVESTKNVTLSGKKYTCYNEAALIDVTETDKDVQNLSTGSNVIGKDFDLYLVNGYVGAAVRTSADASNYSIVTEVKTGGTAGATFTGLQLQVMGADGTKEIISVSKDSAKVEASDYKVGTIVTYSFDKNDMAEVTIEDAVKTASGNKSYNDNTKIVDGSVTTSDCVLFAQTEAGVNVGASADKAADAEWAAYMIRDLDSTTLASGRAYAIVKNSDGKVVAVYMDLGFVPDGAADDTVYAIITSNAVKVGDNYNQYTAASNGTEYTIKTKATLTKGSLVKFRPTADGTYGANAVKTYKASAGTNVIVVDPANVGYVKDFSISDGTLTYLNGSVAEDGDHNYTVETGTKKTYALAKDAFILYVDINSSKSESEASVDHYSEYTGRPNVAFTTKVVDNEEVIDVMFVEVSTRQNINKNF